MSLNSQLEHRKGKKTNAVNYANQYISNQIYRVCIPRNPFGHAIDDAIEPNQLNCEQSIGRLRTYVPLKRSAQSHPFEVFWNSIVSNGILEFLWMLMFYTSTHPFTFYLENFITIFEYLPYIICKPTHLLTKWATESEREKNTHRRNTLKLNIVNVWKRWEFFTIEIKL